MTPSSSENVESDYVLMRPLTDKGSLPTRIYENEYTRGKRNAQDQI